MNLKEAAQQALEYLEQHAIISGVPIRDALRAALGADTRTCTCHPDDSPPKPCQRKYALSECLNAALAEDRVADTGKTSDHFPDVSKMVATCQEFRQVEPVATINEMETVEPVAWTTKGQISAMENGFQHYIHGRVPRFVSPTEDDVPLYTAPPKREPLTDDEINNLELPPNGCTMRELVRVVERAHGIGGEE